MSPLYYILTQFIVSLSIPLIIKQHSTVYSLHAGLLAKTSQVKLAPKDHEFGKIFNCDQSVKNYFEREICLSYNQILAPAATSWLLQQYYGSCSHILAPVVPY